MVAGVLVATWGDGVFALGADGSQQELPGQAVAALASDGGSGVLALVDGHTLRRRSAEGTWTTLATADAPLSCCVESNGIVYVGTDDARVLRLSPSQELLQLHGFDDVEGRASWYAGQALVNGQWLGPPLGVRSLSATRDGVLLANVHVGGIPRSTDGGASWQPTMPIELDVHEVRAHPQRPNLVAAACAQGLCTSRDGGATWRTQQTGLHAPYCSAVAFVQDEVWVAASEHHFSPQGRLYRRSLETDSPLSAVGGGLPEWTDGIVDTFCIAVSGTHVAFADRTGNVQLSRDSGRSWASLARGLPSPSSVHLALQR